MSIKLKDQNNNEIFIAGTNSEDFINDKVLRNDKTWSSNKIVEELYPTFQKEGNPIICYPVENYPLNVKATFSPKQAGSGDPSPENVRPITGYDSVRVNVQGAQLCDNTRLTIGGLNGATGAEYATETRIRVPFIHVVAGQTYTISGYSGLNIANASFYDENQNFISAFKLTSTFTVADGASYVRLSFSKPDQSNFTNSELEQLKQTFMFSFGSTPTPYEPYQPGTTATLTPPETIYGGTVDAVTGVGEKTWGYIASYNGESLPGEWISDRDVYSAGTTPTTGAQVAYKLATPEPFQATGNQPLPAVAGLNTVYTDGDSLIISGKEDIKYTINQITSNIQNINQIQEINNILLGVE